MKKLAITIAAMALVTPASAFANSFSGAGQLTGGLQQTTDLFVTIGFWVGLLAFMGAGFALMWADMSQATQKAAKVVCATGLVVTAPSLWRTIYSGISGALL